MENKINKKLPETGKGNYQVENPANNNNLNPVDNNEVGAPPLVIVVQGGRGVKQFF